MAYVVFSQWQLLPDPRTAHASNCFQETITMQINERTIYIIDNIVL